MSTHSSGSRHDVVLDLTEQILNRHENFHILDDPDVLGHVDRALRSGPTR